MVSSYSVAGARGDLSIENIRSFKWNNRVIVIRVEKSCSVIREQLINDQDNIVERHIVWFVLCDKQVSSNYAGEISDLFAEQITKQYLNNQKSVVLIGKDGGIKYHADELDLPLIYKRVDAMPMRQLEMREQNAR